MSLPEILGVSSVVYYPTLLKDIAQKLPYLYGQVGTRITREIEFATSISASAFVLKYGFAKNSDSIFKPTNGFGGAPEFEIYPQFFQNLITDLSQAYTGAVGDLDYMNPNSGKDGVASVEVVVLTPDAWDKDTMYNTGDIVERLGINYVSIQDDNENKKPENETEWWSLVFAFRLSQTFIIQPLATIADFNDNFVYTKPQILQNSESAKPVFQIDVKQSLSSPIILASTIESDPKIELGAVGFLEEKLNGLPLDIILSDLEINDYKVGISEGSNTFECVIESNLYTLSIDTTLVQLIVHDLSPEQNTNVPYLDLINFSSATQSKTQGYISNFGIIDLGGGKLQVSGTISNLKTDTPVVIYLNVISDVSEPSEQSIPIFAGFPLSVEPLPVFRLQTTYLGRDPDFDFYPEFSNRNDFYRFNNVASFTDDIIICRAIVEQLDDLAVLNSIEIAIINEGAETLETRTVQYDNLPYFEATEFKINSTDRAEIKVIEFAGINIDYPFQIKESWTSKTGIRVTLKLNFTLDGEDRVDIIESAPFRLGTYNQTKNSNTEPNILPAYDNFIKILNESGNAETDQFNKGTNSRLDCLFEDKNQVTDSLQAEESELTGYYGIALPSSPDNLHYIHKEFGALGNTFFLPIDGSLSPQVKITKLDDRSAKLEAIVDADQLASILGDSEEYYISCRLDKKERANLSLDQYSFQFHQYSTQQYEHVLDSDLLNGAFTSVYYSTKYPNQIAYTHLNTGFTSFNFEVFKGYVNSNAVSGDVIQIRATEFFGTIKESIVKLNIPRTQDVPGGSVFPSARLQNNYIEHDSIFVFDDGAKLGGISISGASSDEIFYAIREIGGELTTFKKYVKAEAQADIDNAEKPVMFHVWGARGGGGSYDSISLYYNVEGVKILRTAPIFGDSTTQIRPYWDKNSLVFPANQYVIVGDNTKPYRQIEVRENFTFYYVFWLDSLGGRKQIFTTNSRVPGTPNPLLSFQTVDKRFNVEFVAVDGATVKSLKYGGLGIKEGYNMVIGYWDAVNVNNRHIFINGFLQSGDIEITNGFDIATDTVINSYDEALWGANDFDAGTSEFFPGKILEGAITTELFQDRATKYREFFLKGYAELSPTLRLMSTNFNSIDGFLPTVLDENQTPYPIATKEATTYLNFDSLT